MNIKSMDFLSPPITLFFYENRAHTSNIGGFLVLTMIALSFAYIFYLIYILLTHQKATYIFFKRYEWEAGHYSLNSSSIFHFIQIFSTENGGYFDEYNPRYLHTYLTYVHSNFKDSDLGLYDHWVFDRCRNGTDNKDIDPSLLENIDNFTNSVCIRYYFDSKTRQYFPLGDKEFVWPYMEHGTARKNNIYLTTIVQKCTNNSIINNLFGNCPSEEELDKYINKYFAIYLYFTDTQIDPLNFKKPLQRYLNTITSGIGTVQTFVENYIHFSPVKVRTKIGDFFSKTYDENSFYFDMNRKGVAYNSEEFYKIVKYYHLMQNNMQIYERRYNNIFDIFPQIGGIIQFLFYIFFWVNYFYNKFIIAYDTNSLFFNVKENKDTFNHHITKLNKKHKKSFSQKNYINAYNNGEFNIIKRFKKQSHSIKSCKVNKGNNIYKYKYTNSLEGNTNSKNNEVNNANNFIMMKTEEKNNYYPLTNIKEGKIRNSSNNDNDMSQGYDKSYNNLILKKDYSILNRKLRNSSLDVIKKNSKKYSLFNPFDQNYINNNSQFKTISNYKITKSSVQKIDRQKEICKILIKEDRLKFVQKLSFILYLKSHFVKKYKGSTDFIIRFRRNLLCEEHFFKSHIKICLLFKQYGLDKSQYISFIDCFNNL